MDSKERASVERVPYTFAKRYGMFVVDVDDDRARVIYKNGCSPLALTEVRRFLGMPLHLEQVESARFENMLQQAYESRASDMHLAEDLGDELDLQSIAQQLGEPEDLLESEDDAPIIRLINGMLTEAVKENASDIHIESFESRLRVRFRVDGVLREVLQPARSLAPLIVSRIKVMAKLDIAEKRLPQDGRISLRIAGRPVDVRVSTIPSVFGERVVLRLLDKQAGRLDLDHLGMAPASQKLMDKLIQRPNGILLVTGPTGSGKTTTLYAALTRLNENSRNIMTVEDPIEYHLDGIGQTQVSQKVGMSFARGLRAILRQDPDVVMIGEIRDVETAEIAVQSSLTGHLVLSTLHTNTAVGAMTRLRDMGVEPFLLASTLSGVLAQRLVRKLCPHCKKEYQASAAEHKLLSMPEAKSVSLYAAVGCEQCNHLGFEGRTGIYELVEVDGDMRTMIHDGAGEHALEEYARKRTPSIRQDGMRRVLDGVTTIEEVVRVTSTDKAEE